MSIFGKGEQYREREKNFACDEENRLCQKVGVRNELCYDEGGRATLLCAARYNRMPITSEIGKKNELNQ